jgi:hypothetical protein
MCQKPRNRRISEWLRSRLSVCPAGFDCGRRGSFGCLNGRDSGRFAWGFGSSGLWLGLQHAFDQEGDGAFALLGLAYFDARGEDA